MINDFAQYRDFNDFCQKNQLKPETALQILMDTIDEMEKKIEVITK